MDSESPISLNLLEETFSDFVNKIHDEQLLYLKTQSQSVTGLQAKLDFMKNVLQHAWTSNTNDTQHLLSVLALASRNQRLRPLFGGDFEEGTHSDDSILAYVLDPILKDCMKATNPSKVLENTLRLIANCVADTNHNRKLAMQKGAIRVLVTVLKNHQCLAYVIPALYNLCVEYEDPDTPISTETADSTKANLAQIALAHSDPNEGVMQSFFGAMSAVPDENHGRVALLAELIEMISKTTPDDLLCLGVSPETSPARRRELLSKGLATFLGQEAHAVMIRDADSAVTVCGALVNVLGAAEVKQILVSENQMLPLVGFNHMISYHIHHLAGAEDEADTIANLKACEKALLREFYALSGLPEFSKNYSIEDPRVTNLEPREETEFIQICIERLWNSTLDEFDPKTSSPTLATAYTILANLTISEKAAVTLVSGYHLYEPLNSVLRTLNDVEVLYPGLGLLARLALPEANKQELFDNGTCGALWRFLKTTKDDKTIDWKPPVRIEAITTLRRIISGQPRILAELQQSPDSGGYLRDLLELFAVYKDSSTKIEIGRLFVEHFRTISTVPQNLTSDSKLYERMMMKNNLTEPIAFLACEGQGSGARAEGWFGLGLMTFWEKPRQDVLQVMKTPRVAEEVEKISQAVPTSDTASLDNLKLILSRLDIEQGSADLDRQTRELFITAR